MLAILFICLIVFGAISLPIGIAMGLATIPPKILLWFFFN